MPSKPAQKPPIEQVAQYDLRKVWIPRVAEDGSSSYAPRRMGRDTARLVERLLTRAEQKRSSDGVSTRSTSRGKQPPAAPTTKPKPPKPSKPTKPTKPSISASAKAPLAPRLVPSAVTGPSTPNQRSKSVNQRPKAVRIYEPTTELALDDLKDQEDEQEEEEEEKDEPVLPNPTVEDIAPGLAMLRAQDAFKEHVRRRQLEKHAAGVRRQASDFVTTSDCQEAIVYLVTFRLLRKICKLVKNCIKSMKKFSLLFLLVVNTITQVLNPDVVEFFRVVIDDDKLHYLTTS